MRILYIDIDTLRPDHMSCYGYRRRTTPHLDKIAEAGTRFDRVYCSDAPCLPSRAALISGMFGIKNGAVGHGGTAADRCLSGRARGFTDDVDTENFNHIFRKAGLFTASVSTFAERHCAYWYNAGFHETYNTGGRGGESGEEVMNTALDWMDRHGASDNWYLHVHLWDPHTPYRVPADFPNPFAEEAYPDWITPAVFAGHQQMTGPHGVNEIGMYTDEEDPRFPRQPGALRTHGELRRLFDGYDLGIHYADFLLGRLFDRMRALGIYDDTAFIVTSDHGENMGELGLYSEHGTADEPTCHIPLLIKWPGGPAGHVDAGLHYQLDLAPTMAELLDVPAAPHWDGRSLRPAVTTGAACGRDALVLSQMAHVCQRGARFERWLYIRTVHDGFHLFDDEMLFDIAADPREQHDVKAAHPDICARGAKIILDWQEAQMKTSPSRTDPMWTVFHEGGPYHTWGHLESYCKRLEATGRAQGARALRARHGGCGR